MCVFWCVCSFGARLCAKQNSLRLAPHLANLFDLLLLLLTVFLNMSTTVSVPLNHRTEFRATICDCVPVANWFESSTSNSIEFASVCPLTKWWPKLMMRLFFFVSQTESPNFIACQSRWTETSFNKQKHFEHPNE